MSLYLIVIIARQPYYRKS